MYVFRKSIMFDACISNLYIFCVVHLSVYSCDYLQHPGSQCSKSSRTYANKCLELKLAQYRVVLFNRDLFASQITSYSIQISSNVFNFMKVNTRVNREKIPSVCEIINQHIFEKMQMHEHFQTFGQFIDSFAIMFSI